MSKSIKKNNIEFSIKKSNNSSISRIEELGSDYSSSLEESSKYSYSNNSGIDTSYENIFQYESNNNNKNNSNISRDNDNNNGLVVQGINYQDIFHDTSQYQLYKQNTERNNRQGRLLLVSLLENFCAMYDQSPQINQQLFYVICKQLSKMGIIEEEDFMEELASVRSTYNKAFKQLIIRALVAIK
eukprot:jgi/Orpsp1_1/1184739/evm.model.c7180000090780.1